MGEKNFGAPLFEAAESHASNLRNKTALAFLGTLLASGLGTSDLDEHSLSSSRASPEHSLSSLALSSTATTTLARLVA